MTQPVDLLHRMVEGLTAQPSVRPVKVPQGDMFTEIEKLQIEFEARREVSCK